MSAVPQISNDWQAGFLNILPAIQSQAMFRFRRVPADRREELIQETIAAACQNYQRAAAQGKLDVLRPGPLADFSVRHVKTGRHVGGMQDKTKDVMSSVCHTRHGVRVVSYHAEPAGGGSEGWKQVAIEDRKVPVPDLAAFRIDFAEWLKKLGRRDRKIIRAFVSGERTSVVADRFGITEGRVSQLRRKYERDWRVFQGEAG